eukprot:CAMPEP_0197178280 /NCGR_PEP_ID=MMETSP1423-20130617/3610_1 /TAXON_ID=476441 /ORGANISM="Pseudo-nitzschia heimii, Strain UNC1101" /LENGTH=461 /DNA_ID=CAMNT_0042627989 /DNA_START=188 /DNA_END=1570 /DNA_ORIENTATION=-
MSRIQVVALFHAGLMFISMMSFSLKKGLMLRCHAFASNVNRQKKNCRSTLALGLNHKTKDYPFVKRGGSFGSNSRNPSLSSEVGSMTPLSSTASPLRDSGSVTAKEEFESRVLDSLPIASGGPIPTSLNSFGGIPYQDIFSSKSSLFRVVFVLGGPGAGKGTQCDLLIQNYPCHHLSAGELLREEAKKKDGSSEHAELIEECLVAGKIVPVEISLSLLQNAMRETEGNDSLIFLIDGFPRNFDNLDGWTRCMTRNDNNNDPDSEAAAVLGVLSYDCPLPVLEERVMQRSKDSGRSDDNLESLRRRFKTFKYETVPVVDVLRAIDKKTSSLLKVVEIEGQKSLDEVWEETQKGINSFFANDVLSANMRLLEAIAKEDIDAYQNLCASEMFPEVDNNNSQSSISIMEAQEKDKENEFSKINVKCAEIKFITGKKASVSYHRTSDSGVTFQETRIWSYQESKGW